MGQGAMEKQMAGVVAIRKVYGPFNNYVTLKTAIFRPPLPYLTLRNKWLDPPYLLRNAHLISLDLFCVFSRFSCNFAF